MDKRRRDGLVHAHVLGHLVRKNLVQNLRREYQDISEEIHSFEGKPLLGNEVVSWPRKTTLCFPVFVMDSQPNSENPGLTSSGSILESERTQRSGDPVSTENVVSGRPFISPEPSITISNYKNEDCCRTCPDPPPAVTKHPDSPPMDLTNNPPVVGLTHLYAPAIDLVDPNIPPADLTHSYPPTTVTAHPDPPTVDPLDPDQPAVDPSDPDQPAVDPLDPDQPAVDPSDPDQPAVDPLDPDQPAVDPSDPPLACEMKDFEPLTEMLSLLPDLPQSREGLVELKAQLSMELLWLKQAIASRQSYLQLRKSLNLTEPR